MYVCLVGGVKKSLFLFSYLQSHIVPHTATHANTLAGTNSDQCLAFGLCVVQTGCYTLGPQTHFTACGTFRVGGGPQQQCPGAEHAHTVYLKLYTILQNPGLVVVLPDGSSAEPSSLSACGLLVDPCQLLHNLNDLIHGGFTLHATAVINLGLGDRKLLGGGQKSSDTTSVKQTSACKERERST